MYDRSSTELMNQVTRTRRIAYVFILLALLLPSLFALGDNAALDSAIELTLRLGAVTLLALLARLWLARHYSPGIQVQFLLAFAIVLLGWSGYSSRLAHEERISAAVPAASSAPSHIPGQMNR